MKKLLLATLCISAFNLIACSDNKSSATKAEDVVVKKASYSTNVPADMKSDLEQIQTLSNTKAQEALKFQTEITEALQKGNISELKSVLSHLKTYTESFNSALDELNLKSSEVNKIRDDMKVVNVLSLDLAEAGIKNPPDLEAIQAIQQKTVEAQQMLLKDMQAVQTQVASIK